MEQPRQTVNSRCHLCGNGAGSAAVEWLQAAIGGEATAVALAVAAVGVPLGVVVGRRAVGAFIDRIGARSDALVSVAQIAWIIGALMLLANLVAVLSSLRFGGARWSGS